MPPRTYLRRAMAPSVLTVVIIATFWTQNQKVGFEPGQHGWVSSHTLAILDKAGLENGFVGFATRLARTDGATDRDYFDRYPFVFSASMKHLLWLTGSNRSAQVYYARQMMNVVFLATFLLAFATLRLMTGDGTPALIATLLAFSGYFFMHYKDMVHYDQPAILGVVLLLYAIVWNKTRGRSTWLFAAGVVAVSLGRGYASFALLGVWMACELAEVLRREWPDWKRAASAFSRTDAARLFVVCLLVASSWLTYNVAVESRSRGVSLSETSILQSAQQRLGLDGRFNADHAGARRWGRVAELHAEGFAKSLMPYAIGVRKYGRLSPLQFASIAVIGAFLIYVVARFLVITPQPLRQLYLLMILAGFAWTIPMRNLFVFHEYTMMYHIGGTLAIFAALALRIPERVRMWCVPLALSIFLCSLVTANLRHDEVAQTVNVITSDFENIRAALPKGQRVVIQVDGGQQSMFPGTPYALGWYCSEHWLTDGKASWILTKTPDAAGANLTTGNHQIFLLRRENTSADDSAS